MGNQTVDMMPHTAGKDMKTEELPRRQTFLKTTVKTEEKNKHEVTSGHGFTLYSTVFMTMSFCTVSVWLSVPRAVDRNYLSLPTGSKPV